MTNANDRLLKVHEMVTELWKWYRQAYETMTDTDEWWEKTIETAGELTKKRFGDDRVALDIAISLMNDLERICRNAERKCVKK